MIHCRLSQLEDRCRQRGYTLDEVRACIVSEDRDMITVDVHHPSYPRAPKPGFIPKSLLPPEKLNSTNTDAPSFLEKVKNFAKAAVNHVAAGMPIAGDEEILRRYNICLGCEFLKNNACTKCGCPIVRNKQYISKLSWADSKCPVGKWGSENTKIQTPQ
jgi:hypothetical protein